VTLFTSNTATRLVYNDPGWIDTLAAWVLALLWILPLAYAAWTAFHPSEYSTRFELLAPLTLDNFARAWAAAPFARYFLNTTLLVTMILGFQLVLSTLAAYAFARYQFVGKNVLFALVLVQLMVMPDILLVENYKTMARLGLVDTLWAIGLPYFASAFAIFLLRQTFLGIPKELDEAARVEGAHFVAGAVARVRATGQAGLHRVCTRLGELPLEQLPLAPDHHQQRQRAAADRGPAGVLLHRPGHRLVDHHRRHADDLGPAADRLPALSAPVRAEFHARRHQMSVFPCG
jgi:hypothetical protein